MTIDALICKIYFFIVCSLFCCDFENSNQFSFILKFSSHCLLTYIHLLLRWTFSLFTFSIREYSCNVHQTYLKVQIKTIVVLSFIVFLPLETMVLLVSDKKTQKSIYHLWNLHQGFVLHPLGATALSAPTLNAFGKFVFCSAKNQCTHIFSVLSPEADQKKVFVSVLPAGEKKFKPGGRKKNFFAKNYWKVQYMFSLSSYKIYYMFSNDLSVYFLLVFFAVKITWNTNTVPTVFSLFMISLVLIKTSAGWSKKNLTWPVRRKQTYFFDQPEDRNYKWIWTGFTSPITFFLIFWRIGIWLNFYLHFHLIVQC